MSQENNPTKKTLTAAEQAIEARARAKGITRAAAAAELVAEKHQAEQRQAEQAAAAAAATREPPAPALPTVPELPPARRKRKS